jgi:hypothetical protein
MACLTNTSRAGAKYSALRWPNHDSLQDTANPIVLPRSSRMTARGSPPVFIVADRRAHSPAPISRKRIRALYAAAPSPRIARGLIARANSRSARDRFCITPRGRSRSRLPGTFVFGSIDDSQILGPPALDRWLNEPLALFDQSREVAPPYRGPRSLQDRTHGLCRMPEEMTGTLLDSHEGGIRCRLPEVCVFVIDRGASFPSTFGRFCPQDTRSQTMKVTPRAGDT